MSSTKPADQPTSPSSKARAAEKARHGRRASRNASGDAPKPMTGWGEAEQVKKPLYDQPEANMQSVDVEGEDSATRSHRRSSVTGTLTAGGSQSMNASAAERDELLQREVAAAPVEYHSAMPKIAELDAAGAPGAGKLARSPAAKKDKDEEIDLTCLMGALCAQLDDEDVPWVPELMLVQLTSELFDENADAGGDGEGSGGVEDEDALGGQLGPMSSIAPDASKGSGSPRKEMSGTTDGSGSPTKGRSGGDDLGISAAGRRRGKA